MSHGGSLEISSVGSETAEIRSLIQESDSLVTFRFVSIGTEMGVRFDFTFQSDFGLFAGDMSDDDLIFELEQAEPRVDWSRYVYWRQVDQAKITVINTNTDQPVATITVRRRIAGDPAGETDWTNVVRLLPRR